MELLKLQQGTQEWLDVRLSHFTASEAPVMMGASPHMSRDDLLKYKTTQQEEEVTYFQQKIYDNGHKLEEMARPIAEEILGDELYPVTGFLEVEGLPLLASFDGLDMMEVVAFEHKQWNAEKSKTVNIEDLGAEYYWQLEQQLLVSGALSVLFVMSDGTEDNMVHVHYKSVPERRAELIAGWKQFQKDLQGYEPKVYEAAPEAKPIIELPALSIQLVGQVNNSNFPVYKADALAFVEAINTDLKTDQDFADAENTIKFCDKAEKELDVVKKQALSQTADISQLFREVDELKEAMRAKRLELNKAVKQKKESIRLDIVNDAKKALSAYLAEAEKNIAPMLIPPVGADFNKAIKGKKSIKSLNESANDELARAKMEVDKHAEHIRGNLDSYENLAAEHKFLFNDLHEIILKDSPDFVLLVEHRIDKHERAQEHKREQQRQRIQAEEEAKAKAKVEAEPKQESAPVQQESTSTTDIKSFESVEVIESNKDESDIVHYLYTSHGIYGEQGKKLAKALMAGRVPHVNYLSTEKKAA